MKRAAMGRKKGNKRWFIWNKGTYSSCIVVRRVKSNWLRKGKSKNSQERRRQMILVTRMEQAGTTTVVTEREVCFLFVSRLAH